MIRGAEFADELNQAAEIRPRLEVVTTCRKHHTDTANQSRQVLLRSGGSEVTNRGRALLFLGPDFREPVDTSEEDRSPT